MIFSSYEFIFIFFPMVIVGYFLLSYFKNRNIQYSYLLIMSLVFYGWFNFSYLYIIIFSILFNYFLALLMDKKGSNKNLKKTIMIVGIIINLSLLGYFKYYDFFIENINVLFNTNIVLKNIILPLGISFFTFQQLSFLISCYKNEEKLSNFIEYALFVTFFPQLVAGPIVTYSEIIPQFQNYKNRFINFQNISVGLYGFSIGLFKKIVIADLLGQWVDNGYNLNSQIGLLTAWVMTLAYTFQIYFDFSGYSDMAVGLARMLNINLPHNFNQPYLSRNIIEFWKRWHITLTRALTQYIYIPLGGNRKGKIRTFINIMVVFFVSGLWHGASWTFIVWGLLHGVASVWVRILSTYHIKFNRYISTFLTFLFVNFTWVFFRSSNFTQAFTVLKSLFNFNNINVWQVGELFYDSLMSLPLILTTALILVTILVCLLIIFKAPSSFTLINDFKYSRRDIIFTSLLLYISTICLSRVSAFIYFNF